MIHILKVLIIEDEAAVRSSLIKCVNWEQIGCRVCGEAESGLMALEKFIKLRPDIIVTDVVMPGIDGITFFRYIRSKNENIKVVVITGHRDFEYAKEAVNLGASKFLLKPLDYNEFIITIKRLVLEINQDRSLKNEIKNHPEEEDGFLSKRDELLRTLLQNKRSAEETDEIDLEAYGVRLEKFYVATIGLDKAMEMKIDSTKHYNQIHDLYTIIKEILKGDRDAIPLIVERQYVKLIINTGMHSNKSNIAEFLKSLHKRVKDTFQFDFSFGVSNLSDVNNIQTANDESVKALEDSFFSGENSINLYNVTVKTKSDIEINSLFDIGNELVNSFKNCSGNELYGNFKKLFGKIISKTRIDILTIKSTLISLLSPLIRKIYGSDSKNMDKLFAKYAYFKGIIDANFLYKIEDIFYSLMIDLHDYTIKKKDSSKGEIIQTIIEFCRNNYHRNITLNDLADIVFFSPAYISSFIKSETGSSFVDILNEIRIQKAKELFSASELKTYEIAEKVGISDPKYFSQVFKKVTGKTPTEYYNAIKKETPSPAGPG